MSLGTNISVFPNPTSDKISIVFKKERAGIVFANIKTLQGNTMWDGALGYFEKGQNTFEMPIENLPSGFYTVILINEEGIKAAKVIVNND